ncbi:YSIRK-type signal peptide-containing protein [Streptococcus infantarius]|uniref:lectin-like domain-containing protein n=1 Tax=Streptococcus infantarius TaxID=102684 RepID=UPI00336AC1C7
MRGKQQDFRTEKYIRYGIRKFSFGAASVAIAVGLMFLGNGVVSATEVQSAETAITTSASSQGDKETEKAEPKAETVETVKPETVSPETIKPETVSPETIKPETVNPETMKPETVNPETVKPETVNPETVNSETMKPETVNPETVNSETVNSETVKPETVNPETVNSETVKPETVNPETEKATEVKSEVAATKAATKATLANTDASQADVDAQAETVSALSTAVTESNTAEKKLRPTEIYTTNGTPGTAGTAVKTNAKYANSVETVDNNKRGNRENTHSINQSRIVKRSLVDPSAGKITINRDNFKDFFHQNGSAKDNYDQLTGIQTITNGSFQSGNISFDGSIDVRHNFEIDGAINLGQITSSYGYTGIADGIGFVFYKGERNQVGGNGGDLGIYGVTNAFGWKVDTWLNDSAHTNSGQNLKGDYDDGHQNPYGAFITTNKTGYGSIDRQSAKNLTRSIEDNKFHDVKFIYTANTKEFKIVLSTPDGDVPFSKTFDYDETSPAYYFTIAASTGILPTHQAFRIDSMTYSSIQKAIINYVDGTTGRTIASDSVTGNSEETIDYSTANKISGFQKNGYELVKDGFSKGATYDDDDTVDQSFVVTVKPHVEPIKPVDPENPNDPNKPKPGDPIDPNNPDGPKWTEDLIKQIDTTRHVNRTITSVNEKGEEVAQKVTDKVTFTREGKINSVTGEITYGNWTAKDGDTTFDKVESPVVQGYILKDAKQKEVAATTGLTVDSKDENIEVVYTKLGSWVPKVPEGFEEPKLDKPQYPNDPTDPTKPVQAGQAAATNFVDRRLPQTGEADQQHMTLSGLLLLAMSSLLGLFGMTKRQRKK